MGAYMLTLTQVNEVGINDFCPKPINIGHLMKYLDGKFMNL
jgi:hypothetical protein